MKHATRIILAAVLALTSANASSAACYADYKAKRENPLKLHYGVIQLDVSPCQMSNGVTKMVTDRVAKGGWTLLQVQSVFGDDQLEAKKRDAGEFFLRF